MPKRETLMKLPDDIVGIIPTYGPDQRQEVFFKTIKKSKQKILANLERGFPAAQVDIGFLQWMASILKRYSFEDKDVLRAVVGFCVQRAGSIVTRSLKEINVNTYSIRFSTADDFGTYIYTFSVDLGANYPIPSAVSRQIDMASRDNNKDNEEESNEPS